MLTLSNERLRAAISFLERRARPLEHSRFVHSFRHGHAEDVVDHLSGYRNEDGGFGRALESDQRSSGSSVLATSEALAIMMEIGLSETHPSVDGALRWLLDTSCGFDPDNLIWPYIPSGIDTAPHAPWWNLRNLAETFDGFEVNPRARILAYFWRWHGTVSTAFPGLLRKTTAAVIRWCESAPDETSPDTLRSLLMLAESSGLPAESKQTLTGHVVRMIPASVESDSSRWAEYGLQPTEVVRSPDSPWRALIGDAVDEHLDHIVRNQDPDGSWKPFWDWGGAFPETWEVAREEWAGVLTLRNLRVLRAHGRLSERAGEIAAEALDS